jgi:hypothetical protein
MKCKICKTEPKEKNSALCFICKVDRDLSNLYTNFEKDHVSNPTKEYSQDEENY